MSNDVRCDQIEEISLEPGGETKVNYPGGKIMFPFMCTVKRRRVSPGGPPAPENPAVVIDSLTAATVTADEVDGATSYNLYRGTTTGGPYSLVDSPATPSSSETGLDPATDYFWVWTAVGPGGESAYSAEVSAAPYELLEPSGLISYWPFDGDATDRHGSKDLTAVNSPTYTTGVNGQAAALVAASSQYFTLANDSDIQAGSFDFLFGCDVYFTSLPAVAATLMAKRDGAGFTNGWSMAYDTASAKLLVAFINGGTVDAASSGVSVSTATWYRVVGWHDATNNEIGISVNETKVTAARTAAVIAATIPLNIGAQRSGTLFFLNGRIDNAWYAKPGSVGWVDANIDALIAALGSP